jgi:DNA-binding transcriptional LysR family regulator
MKSRPDLNLLFALDALLAEQNVSRAAVRVGLSTPAMSHALARLRKQLGDPLLVRAGQQMTATPRALDLRAQVAGLVAAARGVMAPPPVSDLRLLRRTFRLRTSDHLLAILGARLDRFLRTAPDVLLHVQPSGRDDPALLRDGALDLAIGVYDYAPYSDLPSDLRIQQLWEDEFVCLVRRDHPTVRRKLSLAQFAALEHVQIAPRGNPGGYVDEMLGKHGLERRITRAVPFFMVGLQLLAETDYLMTTSSVFARRLARKFGLRIVAPPAALGLEPYQVAQIWHPRDDRDPPHRWLREQVAAAAKITAA